LRIYQRSNKNRDLIIGLIIGAITFTLTFLLGVAVVAIWFPSQLSAALIPLRPNPSKPKIALPAPTARLSAPQATASKNKPTATPKPTVAGPDITATNGDHLVLGRPVSPDAIGSQPDWYYGYGDSQLSSYAVHHGVEFVNPIGTPLLAVASGQVVVAGSDDEPVCGQAHDTVCGAYTDFYGNLVVVQLDMTYHGQRLYTLCGHMARVEVQVGQRVNAGQRLGIVGMSGIADGPHCHFEVRLGENDYAHTRDPILWLKPLPGNGLLAGRVVDQNGNFIRDAIVYIYDEAGTGSALRHIETYGLDNAPLVNSDEVLRENFATGDLPVGNYLVRVKIGGVNYQQTVTINDGRLTFIEFKLP
jgi:murein DD-endopeptidase MepM/ murein hydrolase activator NlpD